MRNSTQIYERRATKDAGMLLFNFAPPEIQHKVEYLERKNKREQLQEFAKDDYEREVLRNPKEYPTLYPVVRAHCEQRQKEKVKAQARAKEVSK